MSYVELLGYVGSGLTLTAVCMKTMIPLRFFAMCSNTVLIFYAYHLNLPAIFIVQCILLPLNGFRLFQMRKLIHDVKKSAASDLSVDWLIPYMTKIKVEKNQVLCQKGEDADNLYYIEDGTVYLPELDASRSAGDIVGEIGLFSPEGVRTATVICGEDCSILKISADKVYELYHQNPDFGFYMIRIVTQRLIRDIKRLEEERSAGEP